MSDIHLIHYSRPQKLVEAEEAIAAENEKARLKAKSKYILTVDWCSQGNRGIFAGLDGNCFWRDDRPHTADEMFEILGVFDLILASESILFTEEEMKQYHTFIPLAEYTNQYGIVVKSPEHIGAYRS